VIQAAPRDQLELARRGRRGHRVGHGRAQGGRRRSCS